MSKCAKVIVKYWFFDRSIFIFEE